MTPSEKIIICMECVPKCAAWAKRKAAAAYGECVLGYFDSPPAALTPSSATDHEKEAAQSGRISGCCDRADQY